MAKGISSVEELDAKWASRLEGHELCFNLLSSSAENDFAGMVEIVDDGCVDELVGDIAALLKALGKTDGVKHMTFTDLLNDAKASGSTFTSTGDNNLPKRKLTVLRDMAGYLRGGWNDYGKQCAKFMFERLASIVDNRYCIVIGSRAELSAFLDEDRKLAYTFGQHKMKLAAMDIEPVYEHYLLCLDSALLERADEEFAQRFAVFLRTNGDDLPFRGLELADYLAKHANARQALVLPQSRHESASTQDELDSLIGLERVKATVEELKSLALACKLDEKRGVKAPRTQFHMLFAGNPGVGKTTVARIVGRMLFEIGVIPTDGFVEVTAKDLISASIGESARETAGVIEKARGGVLFIDEAYSLVVNPDNSTGSSHGREALAELVKAMGQLDDMVVFLAGYRDEMRELVSVNPGLQSRIAYTLEFDDYTPAQLTSMFERMARDSGLSINKPVKDRLSELFAFHSKLEHFGNGRFVSQVFQRAYTKRACRLRQKPGRSETHLLVGDIPTTSELLGENATPGRPAKDALEGVVGLAGVKEQILGLERTIAFRKEARRRGMQLPDQSLHMVFSGNPGTGKTTVARIVGNLLFSIGIMPSAKFMEVTARDLVSSYIGRTAQKTAEVIDKASGGVLFIDEAYSLVSNPDDKGSSHGKEALAELVKAMEDKKDRLVIIFAGYSAEMRALLDVNPGMSSRIGYNFEFADYTTDELVQMFQKHVARAGFEMTESALDAARSVLGYFSKVQDFGNGRFVARLVQETIAEHSKSYSAETFQVISAADLPSIEHMAQISATEVIPPQGKVDEETRRHVAYHEAGHAICTIALSGSTDILEITIEDEGTGDTLGHVLRCSDNALAPTGGELLASIAASMGGMAAEEVVYGAFTSGNKSDLRYATARATRYVATYGMSDLGYVQFSDGSDGLDLLMLPSSVQKKVKEILDRAYANACDTVRENRGLLDAVVEKLMEDGSITGEQLMSICKGLG